MRLDKINSGKSSKNDKSVKVFYFKYFCPEQLRVRQFKSVSKAKAAEKRREISNLQRTLPEAPQSSLTPFKIVIDKYKADRVNDIKGKRLRKSSWDGYVSHIKRLYPEDLNDPLYNEKITALESPIKDLSWEFIRNLLDNIDRSQTTREKHFITYTNIITWSVKKGFLARNQADLIANARPAKGRKKQIEIPSEESVAKLIELSCNFWRPFWAISASTGARLGELTALPWRNVHLNRGRIYIEQSTTKTGEVDQPKTRNAYRELPIGSKIVSWLSKLPRDNEFVFPCPEFGLPYRQKNEFHQVFWMPPRRLRGPNEERPMKTEEVYRMGLQPILRDNGLKWAGRIHSLRHFAASRMIEKNWNIKKIQTRLGHANASTTLDIYGHLIERQSFHEEAEELADGLF